MSEMTPAGWAPTNWIGLLSPWQTSMPLASRAILICRGTDCTPLRGGRKGSWSISISGNWRITFRFEDGDVYDVDLVDYH